ncbi:hypothetical protein ACZ90_68140 [Streptomyces albus subsp. albus]|nr:hypothetical protein ACZ90_68140 [Streptomyces albus subsp. albus]
MPNVLRPLPPLTPLAQPGPVSGDLSTVVWPELAGLLSDIKGEVVRSFPEFAHALEGPHGRFVHLAIEQGITTFLKQVARPAAPASMRDEMFRTLGRLTAARGRSLDSLCDTFRVGGRVALRHTRQANQHRRLSAVFLLSFEEALSAYLEQLDTLAADGYLEARSSATEDQDELRRRLLRAVATGTTPPDTTVAELAERAGWRLPQEVSMVALSPEARPWRTALGQDVLLDLSDPQPCLLMPGRLDPARRRELAHALAGARAAVGPPVPLAGARDSLRWARQALGLALTGVIRGEAVVHCEDHLVALLLTADPALLEQIADRELAPLRDEPPARRERLLETLRTWLAVRGTAAQIGDALHIHAQTVRYRMRHLDAAFGRRLGDPDHRFATEAALRAMRLRERAAPPRAGRPHPVHPADSPAGPRASAR